MAAGVALLLAAGALGGPPAGAGDAADALDDPLAAALAPLGPVKAVVSATLWAGLLRGQSEGRDEANRLLADSLLALHPDLEVVREYLALQLLVGEASRAPDRFRHRIAVTEGLGILLDGIARTGSPRLSGTLARLAYNRHQQDPWFAAVVEQYWGDSPEEMAIDELRRGADDDLDRWLLAGLLVEQGVRRLETGGDPWFARRDLRDAREVLARLTDADPEDVARLLAPLAGSLDGEAP